MLNVYDLKQLARVNLYNMGIGAFHSGVEVQGGKTPP